MDDDELDELLGAEHATELTAAKALAEIAKRLADGKRLSTPAMRALVGGLLRVLKNRKAARFVFPAKAERPKGSTKRIGLAKGLRLYGLAKGYLRVPEDHRQHNERQLQRVRAVIRGKPGKPGRPKKPDKK